MSVGFPRGVFHLGDFFLRTDLFGVALEIDVPVTESCDRGSTHDVSECYGKQVSVEECEPRESLCSKYGNAGSHACEETCRDEVHVCDTVLESAENEKDDREIEGCDFSTEVRCRE